MNKNALDFIVIGAQKAGTTSLFKYMDSHPQIFMPMAKEVPFFIRDDWRENGWDWFLSEFFRDVDPTKKWGKITPHYMIYPQVPERIYTQLPHVKLIAILRHPIERAYSQYTMEFRRKHETRTFDEYVIEALKPENLEYARQYPSDTNAYIVNSEYDRILTCFYDLFEADNIRVFFMEELKSDPGSVLQRIFEFIGVDSDYRSSNAGTIYHKGGSKTRIPLDIITSHFLWQRVIRKLWELVPLKHRTNARYWFEQLK